jgi:hypothetical protein
MTLSRRKTLALIGGGVILAATAGAGFAVTRTPRTAHLPWSSAGTYDEPAAARCPGRFWPPIRTTASPGSPTCRRTASSRCMPTRAASCPTPTPTTARSPSASGCFLEIMRMAAAEDGYRLDLTLFPKARTRQRSTTAPSRAPSSPPTLHRGADPLFAQVPHRRSLKEPYDTTRPVSQEVLAALRRAPR